MLRIVAGEYGALDRTTCPAAHLGGGGFDGVDAHCRMSSGRDD